MSNRVGQTKKSLALPLNRPIPLKPTIFLLHFETPMHILTGIYLFFLTTVFPDGNSLRDTIDCPLADYQGKWLGKGFGGVYDNRIIYMQRRRFPKPSEYKIILEQAMRVEDLPGITSVGIRIEKAQ